MRERRGSDALLEPEQEDDLEAARSRAHQVEHRDAAGLERRAEPHLDTLERRQHLLRRQRLAETRQRLELVQQPQDRVVRAQVEPRRLARGRRLGAVRRRAASSG